MPQFNPNDYIDVHSRITHFWEQHPDGAIVTEMVSAPDQFINCVIRADVYKHRDDARPSASGIAGEWKGGGNASNLCWHENAETSAIGRALANMGYAVSQSRASREEMAKLTRHDDEDPGQQPTPMPQRQQFQSRQQQAPQQGQQRQPFSGNIQNPDAPATENQKNFLKGEWRRKYADLGDEGLVTFIANETGRPPQELTKGDASRLIDGLKNGTITPAPATAPF